MLNKAGGIDAMRARQAELNKMPMPKQAKTMNHCMGIAIYPLVGPKKTEYPVESFLHALIRYIPHNVDEDVMLAETGVGTHGLRIRALQCDGKGAATDPCKPCISYAKSQHLINRAVRWASKLDGLLWFELLADGASEEDQTAFEVMIDERDYVEEGRGSEIGGYLSVKNISILRKIIYNAFFKTRKDKMTKFTNMYLEQHVQLSFDTRADESVEHRAKRVMMRTFAQELASGTITMTNVKLSAFVLAGKVEEHDLIPGLLSAHYMASERGDAWRRGCKTGFNDATVTEEYAQANRAIARATMYLSSRLKNRKSTLTALKLYHQSAPPIGAEVLPPVTACGVELHLPRPYQAINFEGGRGSNATDERIT